MANANVERELRLLKQKIDLLLDGYQVLFLKLEQQGRILQRMQEHIPEQPAEAKVDYSMPQDPEEHKVVRLSERFLLRIHERQELHDGWDPDDKTLA